MPNLLEKPRELTQSWVADRFLGIKDYYTFFELAWKVIEPDTVLQTNWHLQYLADRLEWEVKRIKDGKAKKKDLIINIPPGTSKSSLITILFPVWTWLQRPSMRFITASYSQDLSTTLAQKSRDVILSDWFQSWYGAYFRLKYDLNRVTQYQNDAMGIRIATSVGASVTGKHADIIIADDPLNPKGADSEVAIKKCNDWWDKTMSTRLRDKKVSLRIIVAQRVHEDDLTGYCKRTKKGKYELICLPGEITEDVRPIELRNKYKNGLLDPVRMDQKVLDDMKINLGSLGYSGQVRQNPEPEEGNLIKKKWIGRFTMDKFEILDDDKPEVKEAKRDLAWDFALDGAYTKDQQNDPSAIIAYAIYRGKVYVRNVQAVWKEFPELIRFIKQFCKENGYTDQSRVFIEPKANGLSAAQQLRKESSLNIIVDKAPTVDKIARVKAASPFMEAGRLKVLKDAGWIPSYFSELGAFPNAKHDDKVDVTTIAINQIIDNPNKILSVGSF